MSYLRTLCLGGKFQKLLFAVLLLWLHKRNQNSSRRYGQTKASFLGRLITEEEEAGFFVVIACKYHHNTFRFKPVASLQRGGRYNRNDNFYAAV